VSGIESLVEEFGGICPRLRKVFGPCENAIDDVAVQGSRKVSEDQQNENAKRNLGVIRAEAAPTSVPEPSETECKCENDEWHCSGR
jgi:hypothetical protein